MQAGGAACCWCWYTFDAWAPSSPEVGIILVRDLVQVWAITAPSQPLFPLTRHSLTVLARLSLRQWHRRVWSFLVDVRAVLAVLACVMIAQAFATLTKAAGPHTSAQRSAVTTKSRRYFMHTPRNSTFTPGHELR